VRGPASGSHGPRPVLPRPASVPSATVNDSPSPGVNSVRSALATRAVSKTANLTKRPTRLSAQPLRSLQRRQAGLSPFRAGRKSRPGATNCCGFNARRPPGPLVPNNPQHAPWRRQGSGAMPRPFRQHADFENDAPEAPSTTAASARTVSPPFAQSLGFFWPCRPGTGPSNNPSAPSNLHAKSKSNREPYGDAWPPVPPGYLRRADDAVRVFVPMNNDDLY